ncbi:hypothetical protein CLAFUW4_10909 [Fulvia fulva]|uniref:Uncharacterized protein n=1 Tax=Passalora fulva TaxID=5499 RepID=A0A9Q8URV8_PASFU|nr:uncharacterized protein CLAFUR5_09951 [Fulvia fulva]KAK4619667.1 hypothetical protein CLAFUR4_10914 [Fulvia fulva]KAK4620463.1 hypothetical protein CLAFUR0_10921 [Fulvia fulva]UJO20140.1 hypothetical protein CLAFUR5_09951 [Fulvia fulva]WPV17027.1 hypothetical protein CLAFUW4_10909 [Fulvia fulva]WPV31985.1 hypothetical protein CLAFUW7_10907 [Fulvia fulva]
MDSSTNGSRHDRKRSRSPYRDHPHDGVKRQRSRSPHRRHHRHHRDRKDRSEAKPVLAFGARSLHRDDFEQYKPLLAEYLDVQKNLNIDDLEEREIKGRWKRFLGKWNRGELAEGWYDPDMKSRVDERWRSRPPTSSKGRAVPGNQLLPSNAEAREEEEPDDEDDDDFGPAPPGKESTRYGAPSASLQDLQYRQELAEEEDHARLQDLRYQRKTDRNEQKERIEELAPRADPGSRERKLEKKSETTSALNQFREAKDGGDVEVNDNDLMGGGDDGAEGYKKRRQEMERKKGEREIRKEEALRARAAERAERLQIQREKEEKTMANLKAIAKARFG